MSWIGCGGVKRIPALATGNVPTVSEFLEDIADDSYEDERDGY
jgi:hypothetical protein